MKVNLSHRRVLVLIMKCKDTVSITLKTFRKALDIYKINGLHPLKSQKTIDLISKDLANQTK